MKYFYLCLKALFVLALLLGLGYSIYLFFDYEFTELQKDILLVLGIVCASSMAYCFIVGEISRNNSQMDKLWSILPEVYLWIVAIMGGMSPRLVVMAILATIWGARLTYNFAKKGAYSIKFWTGEEDYRWIILRGKPVLKNKFVWAIFDLFFISFYQNFLVLLTVIPAILCLNAPDSFNWIDSVATILMLGAILYEAIADLQQMKFQTEKWRQIKEEGKKLDELPSPYNLGFNTTGLWNYSRHPNYIGEQLTWVFLYLFSIAAGAQILNWTMIGAVLLVLLFIGSSQVSESISSSKYPLYKDYQNKVFKYFPIKKYRK